MLQKRLKDTARNLRLRRLKAKSGLLCPRCFHYTMFIKARGRLLVLIGCSDCNIGDVMPRHPTWKSFDLYNFLCDNWRSLIAHEHNQNVPVSVPEFHYAVLTDTAFEYLREHVTLGKITVGTVTEETEEVDVMDDKRELEEG